MRIQCLIIATLLSVMSWIGAFEATRGSYHYAIDAGLIPNLHIKENLLQVAKSSPTPFRFKARLPDQFG